MRSVQSLACSSLLLATLSCGCDSPQDTATEGCPAGQERCDGACVPAGTCNGTGNGGSGPVTEVSCTDSATASGSLSDQYAGATISVTDQDKSYYLQSNWWYQYENQTIDYDGLSFTVHNPDNIAVSQSDGNPLGYPSLFIGTYSGHSTTGSNLPRQVSALTSVPTVLRTNATEGDISNYNAAYDVWLTASSSPLGSGDWWPGQGGAYLMVWLFDPGSRQPRGRRERSRQVVRGVSSTWDVWIDDSDPVCVSYVSASRLDALEFDLNHFIQDAVDSRYGVTSEMYLSVIFAGFEIWGGGDGLRVDSFCARVE
jgi:hypothetical protein